MVVWALLEVQTMQVTCDTLVKMLLFEIYVLHMLQYDKCYICNIYNCL